MNLRFGVIPLVLAASTGKPVYIYNLPNTRGITPNRKFNDFHKRFSRQGITRTLSVPLKSWIYTKPRDMNRAVRAVKELVQYL